MVNNKQKLIEYLKINYTPGEISWSSLATRFGIQSAEAARSIWKQYRKSKSAAVKVSAYVDGGGSSKSGNIDEGTVESTATSDYEPKTEEDLIDLHSIDNSKYRIKNYWTKVLSNGKFTSSVFCVERKVGDRVTKEEFQEVINEYLRPRPVKKITRKSLRRGAKSLVFFIADEHVGAEVTDGLYDNTWNKDVYLARKSAILDVAELMHSAHGSFADITICNLGDTLDGYNKQTTRGGHVVPQNMTNKEAILTYLDVSSTVWDNLISMGYADTYFQYNVENSNHGGLGWDAAANIALKAYLETKYPNFTSIDIESIIGSLSIGAHDIHLMHGKDEKYMKRNMPLHLDFRTESYLKEYLELNNYSDRARPQHFFKGDLHKFATEQGKYFTYTNIPSLFGSSAWVMANFGNTKPGFCYTVVEQDSTNLAISPYWF